MSYTINLTNGSQLGTVSDGSLTNNWAGLYLIGKGYKGFGTAFNDNLIRLAENFSNSTPPANPLVGQLWWDSANSILKVFDETSVFKPLSISSTGATPPANASEGDQWFNTIDQQLYVYTGISWLLIGPVSTAASGQNGVSTVSITQGSSTYYVAALYADGRLVGLISSDTLVSPTTTGFANLRPGINFVTSPSANIVLGGIYNATELTIGVQDQLDLTIDPWGNDVLKNLGGNLIIASNGNASAMAFAANSVVTGTVYINNLDVRSFTRVPLISVPGVDGDVLINSTGNVGATSLLSINNITSNVLASNITVSSNIFTDTITANHYIGIVIPPFTVPGTLGEFLYSSGSGNVFASANIIQNSSNISILTEVDSNSNINTTASVNASSLNVIGAGFFNSVNTSTLNVTSLSTLQDVNSSTIFRGNQLSINTFAVIGSSLQTQSLTVSTYANVANINVTSIAVFNSGGVNSFQMPLTRGSSGNILVSNGDGTTKWGNTAASGSSGNVRATQNAGLISNSGTGARSLYETATPFITPPSAGYIYQNTSGSAMIVTISLDGGGGGFNGAVYCDASSSPTTMVTRMCRVNAGSSNPNFYPSSFTFVVPPGYYYGVSVSSGGAPPVGGNAMDSWTEWTLGVIA